MPSFSETPGPSGATSALREPSTVGPRTVSPSTTKRDSRGEKAGVGDEGIDHDGRLAAPFRSKPRVLRFEAKGPCARRIRRRRQPAVRIDMRFARQNRQLTEAKPLGVAYPVDSPRRFVEQERPGVRIVEPDFSGAHGEAPGQALKRLVRREARVEFERDRPFGEQRRRLLVEGFEVGQADVAGLKGQSRRVSRSGARLDGPGARRTGRRDFRIGLFAGMIEDEVEIRVRHRAMRRIVVDPEAAVGQGQPVDRLGRAGHRLGAGADQRREIEALESLTRVRQGDRRRAVVARDGDRQRAVLGDPEAQGKPVQLKPTDLHLRQKRREGIEGDLARRRRKNRAPGGVADRQAPEPEADAPGIVHDISRAEIEGIAVASALLQARCDLVVQRLEIDRPLGEADGERQRADEGEDRQRLDDPREHMRDSPRLAASSGRRKARSFGALDHAAHVSPGARARSELESTDQLRNVLRGLRAAKTLSTPLCWRRS